MSTESRSKKRSANSNGKKTAFKATSGGKPIDRPFGEALWRRAQKTAANYRLIIEPEPDLGYLGRTAELPYVMADGKTVEACVSATIEATISAIATMLEQDERPPTPAAAAKRDRQVNIRLTADEKDRLEEAARVAGFRSISDFLRASGLDRAG